MIGFITDPSVDGGLSRRELSEPTVEEHDTLVEVHAYSVNRGELGLLEMRPDAWMPGQDVAGIVIAQAPDGSGPLPGTRVAGLANGGSWSERVNVPSHRLGVLPDEVSFADGAGLPGAGLTALRALRAGGSLLGRRVLVTGASGGVGHFAVQLAKVGGAEVTALVSGAHRFESLAGLDIEVVATLDQVLPFDLVLDGVGGSVLIDAIRHLADKGIAVAYGNASGATAPLVFVDFPVGQVNSLTAFYLYGTDEQTFAQDITYLAGLTGAGKLDVRSSVRWEWSRTLEAVEMLRSRQATGKVVLTIP
jgi:NADPH:quinone reductase-like Zn-dependent oxidoreductase